MRYATHVLGARYSCIQRASVAFDRVKGCVEVKEHS